jgi:hypothetical protein
MPEGFVDLLGDADHHLAHYGLTSFAVENVLAWHIVYLA